MAFAPAAEEARPVDHVGVNGHAIPDNEVPDPRARLDHDTAVLVAQHNWRPRRRLAVKMERSVPQIPQVATWTMTSPGPHTGSGRFASSSEPTCVSTAALTSLRLLSRAGFAVVPGER